MTLKIAINGACGRMGLAVGRLALETKDIAVAEALEGPGTAALGRDYGEVLGREPIGVAVAHEIAGRAEVLVDFSTPEAAIARLWECVRRKMPAVLCTTGFSEPQRKEIAAAATKIPCVFSANMSVGVNVLLRLASEVARLLGEDYDIDIVETHHRFKKDAPSGTAKMLAEEIRRETGRDPRVASIRSGDVVGEHRILFGSIGDALEITHRASSRDIFAKGALRAAQFAAKARPGLYSMRDVLNATP